MKTPDLRALAFADDTTGALEVGAHFAAHGVGCVVITVAEPAFASRARTVVVDTRSRHLAPAEAYDQLLGFTRAARRQGIRHLYEKTDSTLRGNIAAEFRALLDAWPEAILVFVPAYPKLGRIVIKGELRVDGRRVADTPFSSDALNPSRESSIVALLARGCGASVFTTRCAGELADLLGRRAAGSIVVCDGVEEADLEAVSTVVAASDTPLIVAGTGGFSGHWIRALGGQPWVTPHVPPVPRCLVVSGSMHPASREQVRHAEREGIPVHFLGVTPAQDAVTVQLLASSLARHPWCALATSEALAGPPRSVCARIGSIVRRVYDQARIHGLVVFGGDTVLEILEAFGTNTVQPLGEILDGVPASRIRLRKRLLTLVTKAGGFGSPNVIAEIRAKLEERR